MIEYKSGDILSEDVEALVNTVNCVGVMGRGIALQFKKAYPDNFKIYKKACDEKRVEPGKMTVYETGLLTNPKLIINFPTKRHWRNSSTINDIEIGLKALIELVKNQGIKSIAIPPLGCGLGGLEWSDVKPRILAAFQDLEKVHVVIYEPLELNDAVKTVRSKEPQMTAGRAALIGLMDRYLNGFMDPFISLLEIHKLMYFLQEAGEPLRLRYRKAWYGPYADNLRHVLNVIEGHLVSGYLDGGDTPEKQINILPGAVEKAKSYLEDTPATANRFDRVSELVNGFESPFGMELLASVHWVVTQEKALDKDQIVDAIYSWSDHKKQFSSRQIGIAFDVLAEKGWFPNLPA
ncbi:type II toxin-antitoxin system antitoxin DNA ADP-ribosyl glycohydrolase DarG [Dethiosulfovibrio salsuginis]|uniref:O-acetyl-ADP-ribose deacetylase (Regulator of RNase III), contains Macro domain n=1 Tax=Dethiosulfovibrio salsuginis TaxID=561720 RepID=A0A1X7L298_9BACT|nr:macro domain-containing protein [Dethiosulfovibrio salsuginis]SMG47815.1 O-acetyl-ADP-ribose deacetylase (regulator of RNase III), contains Macro domain [Dethiosulfovibrio salsuginis]